MHSKRIVGSLIIVAVIIASAAIISIFNYKDNDNKGMEEPPRIEEENNISSDIALKVPEDAANIGNLISLIDNTSIQKNEAEVMSSSEIESIASSVGLLGDIDKTLNINRYQLADILYNIMYECNKLPEIYGYQITYSDAKEIPTKYVQPVCYVTYLELYKPEGEYSGYTWVTEEELKQAMTNIKVYLDNYTAPDKKDVGESEEKAHIEREQLIKEAEEILKNRVPEDRLNGQSVAIFKNPKTLYELEANINNITPIELDRIDFSYSNMNTTERVMVDYINTSEALLKNNDILNDVIGVTLTTNMRFRTEINKYGLHMYQDEFLNLYDGPLFSMDKAVAIKGNKVVGVGEVILDLAIHDVPYIYFRESGISYDYIGIIVYKSVLEGIGRDNSELINKVLVLIPIEGR